MKASLLSAGGDLCCTVCVSLDFLTCRARAVAAHISGRGDEGVPFMVYEAGFP